MPKLRYCGYRQKHERCVSLGQPTVHEQVNVHEHYHLHESYTDEDSRQSKPSRSQ